MTWYKALLVIPPKKYTIFYHSDKIEYFSKKGDIEPKSLVVVLVLESNSLLYKVMEFKVLSRDLCYESRDKPSQ